MRRLPDRAFWAGKRVFLTGHTGFKGGWLALWLQALGAELFGYALAPATDPNLFEVADVGAVVRHRLADVRDAGAVRAAMADCAPEIVLHLAAQPLVRESYATPVETFATNVMGTLHVLDAARAVAGVTACVIVTSDKVYAESEFKHVEGARLGGKDPYSASKAAAEMAVAGFPWPAGRGLATVRSGNVIGGGDWAADRLVADFCRAIMQGQPLTLRNPGSVRPWQHVLDPLCGYLLAAEHVYETRGPLEAWNFGPPAASEVTVRELAARLCAAWGQGACFEVAPQAGAPHEAAVLRLNSDKASRELGWAPGFDLDAALGATVGWFKAYAGGADMAAVTRAQIADYEQKVGQDAG